MQSVLAKSTSKLAQGSNGIADLMSSFKPDQRSNVSLLKDSPDVFWRSGEFQVFAVGLDHLLDQIYLKQSLGNRFNRPARNKARPKLASKSALLEIIINLPLLIRLMSVIRSGRYEISSESLPPKNPGKSLWVSINTLLFNNLRALSIDASFLKDSSISCW